MIDKFFLSIMYNPENLIATKLGLEYGLKQIFGGTNGRQWWRQKVAEALNFPQMRMKINSNVLCH
jgi:hypothetical protein